METTIGVSWIKGWMLVLDLVVKGGLSVELGIFNIIFYRRFQSRDSPSIIAIVSHLPWFGEDRYLFREVEYLRMRCL